MRRDLRILFAGGGTGGHVYPAIYMAEYLSKHWGASCRFVGTRKGIESSKVPLAGFLVRFIWISGFKRSLSPSNLLFPLKLLISSMQSRKIIKEIKPHLVIGTGGYVSGPVLRQAVKMNIPTAIQEQNSYPGITTRLLAARVDCVLLAYEEALSHLKNVKHYRLVGNPISESQGSDNLYEATQYFGLRKGMRTVLIFGGSQGARNINQAIDQLLSTKKLKDIQVIWQTGHGDFDMYRDKYQNYDTINLCILPFIDRMDYAYKVSLFAVTRAGAMTISELAAAGLPAILIPYPHAAANHQYKNAATIAASSGAIVLEDNPKLAGPLAEAIISLLSSDEKIEEMRKNIKSFHSENTMHDIAEELAKLVENTH
ncbi:MAG: undecaprenyldiphospho-muramoylpentapeptide beta-N-acetylglucosaminyltransferase [Calditrichales bacterium]|nr:MAG: undecaprenyldiphospho-muramoylpentapeptide beta-N-acetylglucosaminyltransferase [Calditrichales bacterium]